LRIQIVRDANKKQFKDERIILHPTTTQVKPHITQSLSEIRRQQ
jgi:hypothetical protein